MDTKKNAKVFFKFDDERPNFYQDGMEIERYVDKCPVCEKRIVLLLRAKRFLDINGNENNVFNVIGHEGNRFCNHFKSIVINKERNGFESKFI
ncbi:hypothetical protein M0R19_03525 [Candidatus Pacearchaeota archaeon]|jgi:hypothetical protein|nr:hypothetical protein [Candidatus Pacearchaeota archaeon]